MLSSSLSTISSSSLGDSFSTPYPTLPTALLVRESSFPSLLTEHDVQNFSSAAVGGPISSTASDCIEIRSRMSYSFRRILSDSTREASPTSLKASADDGDGIAPPAESGSNPARKSGRLRRRRGVFRRRPSRDGWSLRARLACFRADLRSPEVKFSSASVLKRRASSSGRDGPIEPALLSSSDIFGEDENEMGRVEIFQEN
ncbi:protein prenylyltransferase superfamily protein [Striga asiatica]|uniref:Protein prenylyltransferase superfamily protein n=1 Tax=Striga asiatica TaxID=4170 RepID=A0A5A7P201_STRAF|nr:protein prenylyltransferase superfamily protein [Striga asiatica]